MNCDQQELLERLDAYSPDDPDADFPFSARLARDNGWTSAFALRVIREYKRFAFLAVAAGHPVTPSDEVDQAWHLHLLYTRSYWDDFCHGVLGRPLHHTPTNGGDQEQGKFIDWYERTLASYRRLFGEEPPGDIWPGSAERFGGGARCRRVDAARNWILPKPRWWRAARAVRSGPGVRFVRRVAAASAWMLPAAALSGCRTVAGIDLAAPHVPGAIYLKGAMLFGALGIGLAAILRHRLGRAAGVGGAPDGSAARLAADPYAVACLSGRECRTADAAVARLVQHGVLAVDSKNRRLLRAGACPVDAHPLEVRLFDLVDPSRGTAVATLREAAVAEFAPLVRRLREAGLLVDSDNTRAAVLLPLLVALLVPAAGIVRIVHGVGEGRPVGFLVGLVAILVFIAFAAFGRVPWRTPLGGRVIADLKRRHRPLRTGVPPHEVPLAVGLFGPPALASVGNEELVAILQPPVDKSAGASGGCGTGCGGHGGGGGGGGGCGGCGGCGG